MKSETKIEITPYKGDKLWQAKARKQQSDFREQELRVSPVPNSRSGCFGNVISDDDGDKGLNFYIPFWLDIKADLNGTKGAILTNLLRSEHIPYNIFFPMRCDLDSTAVLFRRITRLDIKEITDIVIEYAPEPIEEYLNDHTSFDTYIAYRNSAGDACGIGIEVKYTEQGYPLKAGSDQEKKILTSGSPYYQVTKNSGCFDYGTISEYDFIVSNFGRHKHGDEMRQLWRNHILGLSMIQKQRINSFLSIHLYPSFNEHFNPMYSSVLADYESLLTDSGRKSFLPITFETLFAEMESCGLGNIDSGWIPYLKRRYIIRT